MTKLSDLGFEQWFQAHVSDLRQEGCNIARVSAVDRGSYLVRNEFKEIPAELAGKLYFQVESSVDLPCIGDWGNRAISQQRHCGNYPRGVSEKDLSAPQICR